MRVNVEKVLERDQKISELDKRADDLQVCKLSYMAVKKEHPSLQEIFKKTVNIDAIIWQTPLDISLQHHGPLSGT